MNRRARALRHIGAGLCGAHLPPAMDDAQWLALVRGANEHLLGPALHGALTRSGAIDTVPKDVRAYLAMLADLNLRRNTALRDQTVEILRALNAAGIRPMLLKGAIALFCDIYRDPAARMIGDIDILVEVPQADAAVAVLDRLGYRIETSYQPVQHAVGEFVRNGDPGAVDLHVELIDSSYLMPAADIWPRAQRMQHADAMFFVPSATDMVLHNLLHTQIHHGANYYRGVVELRPLYEFTTLARHFGDAIDWDGLDTHLARYRLRILLHSYALLAQSLFGLSWKLRHRPDWRARIHAARCRAELSVPELQALAGPWANLRFAFAGHRMKDLYPRGRNVMTRRLRHAAQFVRKSNARDFVWRLFRPQ